MERKTNILTEKESSPQKNTKKNVKKRSFLRFILKSIAWIVALVLIIVIALILTAEFAHDKVVQLALPSVQTAIDAPVSIGRTSLSFIRAFPYTTLEIDDVYLGSAMKDSTLQDSLIKVEKLYVSLRSEPLMDGKIEIVEVEFKGATLRYLVDSAGRTCYDFLTANEQDSLMMEELADDGIDTTGLALDIDLEKLTISDITCYYNDRQLGVRAKAYIPKIVANGALSDSLIRAHIVGSVQVTDINVDSTNINQLQMIELKVDANYNNTTATLNDLTIAIDDILLTASGSAVIDDSIYADVHVESNKIDLAKLLKLAPDGLLDELGIKKLEGQLHLNADVKGNVTDSLRYPHVDANLGFENGLVLMEGYPQVHDIEIDADATTGVFDTDESITLNLKKLHFATAQSSGTFSLLAGNLNQPHYNLNGKLHIAMQEVAPFIPDDLGINRLTGSADLGLTTHGVFRGDVDDAFIDKALRNTTAKLALNNMSITMDSVIDIDTLAFNLTYANYGITIDRSKVSLPEFGLVARNIGAQIGISGGISDFSKTAVDISKFHLDIGNSSSVNLDAKLQNLDMPTYQTNLGLDIKIEDFGQFLPDSLAYSITGGVGVDVQSHGTVNLDSIETQMFDLVINNTEIKINVDNIAADMYDPIINFSNLNGKVHIANDTINVDGLNIDWQGLSLHIDSTTVANALKIFVLEQTSNKLEVLTKIGMDDFNYAWVDQTFPSDSTEADTAPSAAIDKPMPVAEAAADTTLALADSTTLAEADAPYSFLDLGYPVEIKGMFKLGHLQYEKTSIDNVSAKFNVNDTIILIDQLKLGAFRGNLNASARVKFKTAERMMVHFRANIDKMDLNQLLLDFDNFDQDMVTADNLSGLMTANLDGYADVLNMGDSIPMEKIKLLGNIRLDNGAIVDMEMLKTLDRFVNMHELDNIQFQTLETSIFVRNNNIYLPQTDIKTSAMNLSLFAMQSFADDFEYHIKIFPGEIMLGNSKKVLKKQSQMDDNLANETNMKSINLLAYQIGDDSKYWFDTETRKKKMRTKIKVQQKQLELGFSPRLIKYDTGVKFQ